MSSFLSLLPADGWPRVLSDAVWQSTLIGIAGLLIARFLVRQSAAKAWVLLLALSACLLVPLASMSARSAGLGMLSATDSQQLLRDDEFRIRSLEAASVHQVVSPETSTPIAVNEDRAAIEVGNRTENEAFSATLLSIATQAPAAGRWMFFSVDPDHVFLLAFAILWCAASILLIGRFMLGCFATWRLVRRTEVCTDAALLSAATTAVGRVGLAGTPHLLVSREITTPMILALGRPRLLVPTTIHENRTDWTAAFSHELAHAVRGDGWTRLWSEIVLIALPLQPLVWLLRRSFHIACEEACDDWAVATGGDPVDLAEAMTAWIHRSRRTALLAAIGMSSTKARMLRLLNLREKPVPQLRRSWRWGAALIVILLISGLAAAQTQSPPADESKTPEISKADSRPKSDAKRLFMGVKSEVTLNSESPMMRAQSSDPGVVDLMPISPNEFRFFSKKSGRSLVTIWKDDDHKYTIECIVDGPQRPAVGYYAEQLMTERELHDAMAAKSSEREVKIKDLEGKWKASQQQAADFNAQFADPQATPAERKRAADQKSVELEKGLAVKLQLDELLEQKKLLAADSPAREERSNASIDGVQLAQGNKDATALYSVPKEDVEKRLNDDSLVVVFARRIASDREYLKETPDDKTLLDDIKSLEERIEKRKAEIRPRIVEQLRLEQSESNPNRPGGGSVDSVARNPYIIEPPDIITLDPVQLVPKKPVRIAPLDKVRIVTENTKFDNPISGNFQVDSSGEVVLGPGYGAVKLTGLTRREAEEAVTVKLQETLNDPHVALIIDESRLESGIKGEHLVGPDGTITLGTYGSVYVAGLTIAQARHAIEKSLGDSFASPKVAIEVKSYNSKVYYVILEGNGLGDSILRFPITGTECVLDAIAQVRNLSGLSQAKISIARPSPKGVDEVIQIDWAKALEGGQRANPQILPGDRVFVRGAKIEPGMKEPPGGSFYPPTPAKPQYQPQYQDERPEKLSY